MEEILHLFSDHCECGLPAGLSISHLQSNLNGKGYVNFGIVHKFILCTEYHKWLQRKFQKYQVDLWLVWAKLGLGLQTGFQT